MDCCLGAIPDDRCLIQIKSGHSAVAPCAKIDQFWSTYALSQRYIMSTLDEITKEKQRLGEALARIDAQRERQVSKLRELEAAERVLALHQGPAGKEDVLSQNACQGNDRNTGWRQARLVKSERSGSCSGNRQDAAGNHRCMQGRSPEPCRRRHCPAQAGWPHRRARRKALRHTGDRDGATRRGLTQDKRTPSGLQKECPAGTRFYTRVNSTERLSTVIIPDPCRGLTAFCEAPVRCLLWPPVECEWLRRSWGDTFASCLCA